MAIKKETTQELTFQEKLSNIQFELKSPKSQYNSFGKYKYRNQEDILESVKPLLNQNKLCMSISDDIVEVGGRIYVKATVRIYNDTCEEITTAFAREEDSKKGMDSAQLTGATSSYARKYALNGMFLIDDTKDADATNTHGKELEKPTTQPAPVRSKISDLNKVKIALGNNREAVLSQLRTSYVMTLEEAKSLGLTEEEMKQQTIK